jgi:hypothetical protein
LPTLNFPGALENDLPLTKNIYKISTWGLIYKNLHCTYHTCLIPEASWPCVSHSRYRYLWISKHRIPCRKAGALILLTYNQ